MHLLDDLNSSSLDDKYIKDKFLTTAKGENEIDLMIGEVESILSKETKDV